MKYHIITYGCQMNVHESEKLAGILREREYEETQNRDEADIIILNTCCVRESAENHILGNLGQIKKLKEIRPSLKIAVCGCMTQKESGAQRLKERCPFVDIIFGTHNLSEFGTYLDALNHKKRVIEVWQNENEICESTPLYRTSGINAWVNIMYGCDNFCSYCIVPYVRGRERSRKAEHIFNDIKKLNESNYKEITLLGQNVNSYRSEFNGKEIDFPRLLEHIAKISGKIRIKFMTSHPKDFSENLVKVIAEHDNIAKFIHLPVQSGSDRILSLMNRKYTALDYLKKIDFLKKHIPQAGLSTDIMVGFPTETESDFLDTLSVVERVGYSNVYSFIYSKRSGTKAEEMDGQIDKKTKQDRIKRLIDKQFVIGNNLAKDMIGNIYEVLCTEYDGEYCSSRTSCNHIVKFKTENDPCGEFKKIKVIRAKNSNLFGELV